MDLFSIKTIKSTLQAQVTKPRKGLGQNFFTSKRALGDILNAASLKKSDTVLEIGPGIGTLTRELAKNARRVIAVEKDPAMVKILRKTTKDLPNIEIIHGDILKLDMRGAELPLGISAPKCKYKVVANLPYYITSHVIRMFLEAEEKPDLLVLMVQKEVAQRICACPAKRGEARPPGAAQPSPMNLLAVSVQFYARPEIISYVNKGCFWPQPKVDSAILKIVPHKELRQNSHDREKFVGTFFRVVKAGFKQPRKQLLNNLAHGLGKQRDEITKWLKKHGIQGTQRAETLNMQDWINLAKSATI